MRAGVLKKRLLGRQQQTRKTWRPKCRRVLGKSQARAMRHVRWRVPRGIAWQGQQCDAERTLQQAAEQPSSGGKLRLAKPPRCGSHLRGVARLCARGGRHRKVCDAIVKCCGSTCNTGREIPAEVEVGGRTLRTRACGLHLSLEDRHHGRSRRFSRSLAKPCCHSGCNSTGEPRRCCYHCRGYAQKIWSETHKEFYYHNTVTWRQLRRKRWLWL